MNILPIIIPVYNEKNTIRELVDKVKQVNLVHNFSQEIIVVDDGSTDGTRDILPALSGVKLIYHEHNPGKGAAIRTGIKECTGNYIIIQDADLEYNPNDFNLLLEKAVSEDLPVVYGSRELKTQHNRYCNLSFYLGGLFLTKLTNLLYAQKITDEATCYKLFKADLLKSLPLHCNRFEFCPEVTARVAKKGIKIPEVGISYYPRHKSEGKKINWRDGLEAIWTLIKYKFVK